LQILYNYIKNFTAIFFIYRTYTVSFNNIHRHLHLSICSLHVFACQGNAGIKNVYNGCQKSVAVEASYEWCTYWSSLV